MERIIEPLSSVILVMIQWDGNKRLWFWEMLYSFRLLFKYFFAYLLLLLLYFYFKAIFCDFFIKSSLGTEANSSCPVQIIVKTNQTCGKEKEQVRCDFFLDKNQEGSTVRKEHLPLPKYHFDAHYSNTTNVDLEGLHILLNSITPFDLETRLNKENIILEVEEMIRSKRRVHSPSEFFFDK